MKIEIKVDEKRVAEGFAVMSKSDYNKVQIGMPDAIIVERGETKVELKKEVYKKLKFQGAAWDQVTFDYRDAVEYAKALAKVAKKNAEAKSE